MLFNDFANLSGSRTSSTRWNINQFVNTGKKRHSYIVTSDIEDKDAQELDRICRSMDLEYNKINSELERAAKDLTSIGSQLKKRIENFSQSGEPGEVEIQYRKMEMDLVTAKSKISESKIKLFESKLKQIRDERKLIYDRMKSKCGVNEAVTNLSGAPGVVQVANANMGNSGPGVQLTPEMANLLRTQLINNAEVPNTLVGGYAGKQQEVGDVAKTEKDSTFQVEKKVEDKPKELRPVVTNNTVKDDEPLTINVSALPNKDMVINNSSALGIPDETTKTLGDQYVENLVLIKNREKNKRKMLEEQSGVMGAKMMTSLNSIINNAKEIKEKMFVDTQTGRYWVEGFEEDENGNLVKCDTYQPKSILHLGKLRFDAKNQVVKTSHYDDSMPFEIKDESNMTGFYQNQWNKDSSNAFVLDEGVLELL